MTTMTFAEALAYCGDHMRGRTESLRVYDREGFTHWIGMLGTGWPVMLTDSDRPAFAQRSEPFTSEPVPSKPPGIEGVIADLKKCGAASVEDMDAVAARLERTHGRTENATYRGACDAAFAMLQREEALKQLLGEFDERGSWQGNADLARGAFTGD